MRALTRELIEVARAMARQGLVIGTEGNVSARIDDRSFLITPSGMPYESLEPEDLVPVELGTGRAGGVRRPSVEWRLHAAVYEARPDLQAVVHTHSVYATALAAARRPLPPFLDELAAVFGGEVPVAPFAPSGTPELAAVAAATLGRGNAVLLAQHGVVAAGESLSRALACAELVERAACIFLLSQLAGGTTALAPEVVAAQHRAFRSGYGQAPASRKELEERRT